MPGFNSVSSTRLDTPDLVFSVARKELVYTGVEYHCHCSQK